MRQTLVLSLLLATASAAAAAPLDIVTVGAPAINCKFDLDCTVTVNDTVDHFTIGPTSGDAFLQSRTLPVGEPGTAAAGFYAYEYRLDLRQLAGLTAPGCVGKMTIDFGPVEPFDYDDDGNPDDVWVVTSGGLGTVAPSAAEQTGTAITFTFNPPVCSGASPGTGESSYFFGLTSRRPPRDVTAQLDDPVSHSSVTVQARAPEAAPSSPWPPWWWIVIILVILGGGVLAYLARRKR